MKKVLLIAAAMFAALISAVALAPAASAYPETTCSVSVSAQIVNSGDTFTSSGSAEQMVSEGRSARAAADDVTWTVTFNGETRHSSGVSFSQNFKAPVVTEKTIFPLTAKAVLPDATTNCVKTVNITVLPSGIDVLPPDDGLPNTGGPHLSILIAGLVLVGAGTYAVRKSRRHAA